MKEAIANAGVFNLIITFVVLLLVFFTGSLSYTKAFKVKNKIIEEIEKDQGYFSNTATELEEWMKQIGYRTNTTGISDCAGSVTSAGVTGSLVSKGSAHQYCVYEFNTCANTDTYKCGNYYRVTAYMYFDLPVISSLIKIPVTGETMIFNEVDS